jgi:hypothetical protein
MSQLMFVAVPGGRTPSGDGLLRVLIVPVLDQGETLQAHQMATWPPPELTTTDARLSIEVRSNPSAPPTAPVAARPLVDAVPGLWQRFFGSITVRPPGAPVTRRMDVQPTTEQADGIVGAYREVARELTSEEARPAFEAMSRDRAGALADLGTLPVPQPGTGTPSDRKIDFHLATSVLREHPSVLRALGLIVDLTVPASAILGSGTAVVQVSWPTAPAGLPAVQPHWTRFVRNRFLPAPGPGSDVHPAGGMVALARTADDQSIWRLHTVDVDHALRGLAAAAVGESDGRLPALRTAGVLLARVGRALELAGRQTRNGRSPTNELFAEHLTLGYRVDARILGGDWHSLCRRRSRYLVNDVEFATGLLEEGHVKVGGGIDRGDKVLRTDEIVARWDGWSLAVPRPALRDRPPGSTAPTTELPFDLDTSGIEVEPGTLLRLRFGEDYQLRARVADIAGGGPGLGEPSLDGCDSETVLFRRLEPVLPPDVRVPEGAPPFGPGASVRALVIRTAEGIPDSVADTTRELVPPAASFEVIERHGRLDGLPEVTLGLLARADLPDPAAGGVVGFIRGAPGEPPRDHEPQDWTSSRPGPPTADPWPDLLPKRVVLRAREGDQPTLDWETDELLVVRLRPAQEATLELSSLIDQAAKPAFAISDWLGAGGSAAAEAPPEAVGSAAAAEALLADGRHPMATPAHRITVRHAVRTPRGRPDGELVVTRDEGATWGLIEPDTDRLVGIDPASTVAVEVTASWTPVDDTADPPVAGRPVGRIAVGRADQEIARLRHEFGDTKHRRVTYTWTALSRFRDCFPASDPETLFRNEGTIDRVLVESSARPVVPVVRSVTPAFVWQEDRDGSVIVRRRLGHRLRVELATPWFSTGDGEQLAVLCADGTPAADVAQLVTQAGRDPLWLPGVPPRFPVPVGELEEVTLSEGPSVRMVAHGVFQVAGSAFADIALPQTSSYSPLVQLAMARFQRNSLTGLSISPVVRTDFVPLLPDRTLTVAEVADQQLQVRLDGFAPAQPRQNRVDAVVEQRIGSDNVAIGLPVTVGDRAAWRPVTSVSGRIGENLSVPLPAAPDGVRIRVREVEMIGRDTNLVLGSPAELDDRVVFTDTVEVAPT